jgi:hypothetical protein
MQEIIQSLQAVTGATGFWFYMGGVVSLGMVVGNKFDDKYRGLSKSLTLLSPYVFILFLTTASRLVETGFKQPLGSNAYNSTITLLLVTFFYILGLFIGHVILEEAHKKVKQ